MTFEVKNTSTLQITVQDEAMGELTLRKHEEGDATQLRLYK
jgi:hypothetical protein